MCVVRQKSAITAQPETFLGSLLIPNQDPRALEIIVFPSFFLGEIHFTLARSEDILIAVIYLFLLLFKVPRTPQPNFLRVILRPRRREIGFFSVCLVGDSVHLVLESCCSGARVAAS